VNGRCDVIIPVKNAVWWVAVCLEELFGNSTPQERGRVIVVDDSSTERSFAILQKICARHPEVELVRNTGRPGFGGACNLGVARSSGDHFLLLNTDCLITRGTIRKLLGTFADPTVGMACPLSNNSPVLTLPLRPGRSYQEMNALLEVATLGSPPAELTFDACTVVGNCLMISRSCWDATGEFSEIWEKGYGEETDFQMRAMRKGFRGVARIDSYVFHFGSASFRYDPAASQMQQQALARFLATWGEEYRAYAARCAARDPVVEAARALDSVQELVRPDVLFLLPGVSQTVGGVHVVLDLCNYLIRHGVEARCAVPAELDPAALSAYQEPIYFGLLQYRHEAAMMADDRLSPRMVVASLFSTSLTAFAYSRLKGIPVLNFIQGYEFYFENGTRRAEVEDAYAVVDEMVTTSAWLEAGIKRYAPDKRVTQLPIGVDEHMFSGGAARREDGKVRVAVVLRSAPDKGQWVLQEMLHDLARRRHEVCVTIFSSQQHSIPREWTWERDSVFAQLPLDRGSIADRLSECDVLVDASLHEGFGLLPLEAMASGATVVASDSGGVQQFLSDGVNGLLIREVNKPERYLAAVERLVDDREMLARLRTEAMKTAAGFTQDICYGRYANFFRQRLNESMNAAPTLDWAHAQVKLSIGAQAGIEQLVAENDVEVLRPDDVVLRSTGTDPRLLLPELKAPPGTRLVMSIDIESPANTTLQLFCPTDAPIAGGLLRNAKRAVRNVLRRGNAPAAHYTEERSVRVHLSCGRNQLQVELPPWTGGRLRLDPGEVDGDFILRALEIRDVNREATALRLERPADFAKLHLLGQLEWSQRGDLVIRSTGEQPVVRLPRFECRMGERACLWIDLVSPVATVLTVSGVSRSSTPREETSGWEEWSIRSSVRKGPNALALPLTPGATELRLQLGAATGDYTIRSVEVRVVSMTQLQMSA